MSILPYTVSLWVDSVNDRHVHCSLFMNGAKCGDLVFLHGEYQLFGAALGLGCAKMPEHLTMKKENDVFRKWAEEYAKKEGKTP